MRALILGLVLLAAPALAAPAPGTPAPASPAPGTAADEMAACTARHAELRKQAATFQGDPHFKRLIEADLDRALKEQAEGDGDECLEALDHAAKLLAGEI